MRFSDGQDIDYNQLVVGGFSLDTPRKDIECAMAKSRELWTPQYREMVTKTLVRGQKAQNAHIYLQELPLEKAKERFFHLQQLYADKLPTGTGHSWMSANKSAERRARNWATRQALNFLESLLHRSIPAEDVDWSTQLIWLGRHRVAATSRQRLLADRSPVAQDRQQNIQRPVWTTITLYFRPFLACEPGQVPGG